MQDARFRMCRMHDAGCTMQDAGCTMQDAGRSRFLEFLGFFGFFRWIKSLGDREQSDSSEGVLRFCLHSERD